MNGKRIMLRHFLAAIAYRTQKAIQGAPSTFSDHRAIPGIRTPHQLIFHMTNVPGYARTFFKGGRWRPDMENHFQDEVLRLHEILESLKSHLEQESPFQNTTPEKLLQGPFSDAMTHAGQLAMLRRFFGSPVPPGNFIMADIDSENAGPEQPDPIAPDREWYDAEGRPQR